MTFAKQEIVDRIIERCIATKTWRSACESECLRYATKGERKAVAAYVRKRYDAAGAGFSGRWQAGNMSNTVHIECACKQSWVIIEPGASVFGSFYCSTCGALLADVATLNVPPAAPGQRGGSIRFYGVTMHGGGRIRGGDGAPG